MGYLIADIIPALSNNDTSQSKLLIQNCLDHSFHDDALFLAELLHEKVNDDETLLLLCDCLIRLLRIEEVYNLLLANPKTSARVRYMFAKCCYDLKKYDECERVLFDCCSELHPVLKDTASAPFARILLANVLCESGQVDAAINESKLAVIGNSFLWSAVNKYVQIGGRDVHATLLETERKMNNLILSEGDKERTSNPNPSSKKTPIIVSHVPKQPFAAPRKSNRLNEPPVEARRSSRQRLYSCQDVENVGSRASSRPLGGSKIKKNPTSIFPGGLISEHDVTPRPTRISRDSKPLTSRNANPVRSLSSSSSTSLTSVISNTGNLRPSSIEDNIEKEEKNTVSTGSVLLKMMSDIRSMAAVEEAVGKHDWKEAQLLLGAMPWSTGKHPVAMQLRARVMLECLEYESAKTILLTLKQLHPHRIEGVELLSTAMWQLQDNYGLSALAQELTERARRRPQTWCVAGNCFSLQRQHAQAVECMQRAIQIDPHFAYAYTLLGHELVSLDELDNAANAFRRALSISPNDYRAWYGLSQVHQRKEEIGSAHHNLERALAINPTNRAMLCALAQLEQSQGHSDRSMQLLNKALALNPHDVACRYNRARLLFDMKKNEECLKELEALKGLSPDEAHIFHLLGKVHRRLGNNHLSLLNYSLATEMDPRGEQMTAQVGENPYEDDSFPPDE